MSAPGITEGMWQGLMGQILYTPLLNVLILLYVYIPGTDLGLAIIALTALIRLLLHPSYAQSLRAQVDMQRLQPFMNQIREKYKDEPQVQSQEIMKLYKEHKVNPLGSCLPLLIQLPILLALYRVFIAGLDTSSLAHLYSWFPNPPVELSTTFLGFTGMSSLMVDLTERNIYLSVVAGLAQFLQSWISLKHTSLPGNQPGQALTRNLMVYLFPVVTVLISMTLPSALALYWAAAALFMTLEQALFYRGINRQEKDLIVSTHHGKTE